MHRGEAMALSLWSCVVPPPLLAHDSWCVCVTDRVCVTDSVCVFLAQRSDREQRAFPPVWTRCASVLRLLHGFLNQMFSFCYKWFNNK